MTEMDEYNEFQEEFGGKQLKECVVRLQSVSELTRERFWKPNEEDNALGYILYESRSAITITYEIPKHSKDILSLINGSEIDTESHSCANVQIDDSNNKAMTFYNNDDEEIDSPDDYDSEWASEVFYFNSNNIEQIEIEFTETSGISIEWKSEPGYVKALIELLEQSVAADN